MTKKEASSPMSPTIGNRVRQRKGRMGPRAVDCDAEHKAAAAVIDLTACVRQHGKRGKPRIATDKSTAAGPTDDAEQCAAQPFHQQQQCSPAGIGGMARSTRSQLPEHCRSTKAGSSSMQLATSISSGTTLAAPSLTTSETSVPVVALLSVAEPAAKHSAASGPLAATDEQSPAANIEEPAATEAALDTTWEHKEVVQVEKVEHQELEMQQLPDEQGPAEASSQQHMTVAHGGTAAEAAKARAAATAAAKTAAMPKAAPKVNPVFGPTAADLTAAARVAAAVQAGARDSYGACLQRFGKRMRGDSTEPDNDAEVAPGGVSPDTAADAMQVPSSMPQPQEQHKKKKRRKGAKACATCEPVVFLQQQVQRKLANHPLLRACVGDAPLTVLGAHMTPTMAACFKAMLQQRLALLHRPSTASNCAEQLQQLITSFMKTGYVLLKLSQDVVVALTSQARDELQELLVQHASSVLQRQDVTCADVINNLPADVDCDQWLEVYTVGEDDPHAGLHGNKGARAKRNIPSGQFLGFFAGHLMSNAEREDPASGFEMRPPACVLYDMHQHLASLPHEQQVDFSQTPMLRSGIAQLHYIDDALCHQLVVELDQARSNGSADNREDSMDRQVDLGNTTTSHSKEHHTSEDGHKHASEDGATGTSQEPVIEISQGGHNDKQGNIGASDMQLDSHSQHSAGHVQQTQGEDKAVESGTIAHASYLIAAGKADGVIWDMMCSQLAQLQDRLSVPLDMQLLCQENALLQACLQAAQASWAAMCDAYGMDVSFKVPPWMKTTNVQTQNVDPAQVATLTQGWDWLNYINSITISAMPTRRNSTAYVNDPAMATPSSYLEPTCRFYPDTRPNCIVAELCVAGWPFPCFVATTPIAQGTPISFTYGVHFWVGRAKRLRGLDDAIAHLEMALRCHKLEQQVKAMGCALEASPTAMQPEEQDQPQAPPCTEGQ